MLSQGVNRTPSNLSRPASVGDPEIAVAILADGVHRAERNTVAVGPGRQGVAGQEVVGFG